MKQEVKHIFFDLDHTLWDFEKNSALTFDKIFKINQVEIPLDKFLEIYIPLNLKYWKLYREEKISKENLRYKRLKAAFDAMGYKASDELINLLAIQYIKYLSTFNHVFEYTVEILEYLKPKYELHIITNGFEEVQEKKLKGAGLFHFFKTVTNSEMVGVKKPNPKMFHFALNLAKAIPQESLMIGDSLEADIEGAQQVDMPTILFDPTDIYSNYKGEKIQHLKELVKLL